MINWFEWLVTIAGIVMSFSYYPQAYKIFKSKSAENVSLLSYLIFSLGTVIWFVYGILKKDFTIISGFFFGVVGSWLVLILLMKYRKK